MCLLHFNVSKGILQENQDVEVIDTALLASQTSIVRGLWDEAIADVVVRMLELQQEEQRDPLSVLDSTSITIPDVNVPSHIKKRHRTTTPDATASPPPSSALSLEVPCENCGSKETHIIDTSGLQNDSRSEKWGYREHPEPMLRISCDDCGHVAMKMQ